jgi:hypothetical protein
MATPVEAKDMGRGAFLVRQGPLQLAFSETRVFIRVALSPAEGVHQALAQT